MDSLCFFELKRVPPIWCDYLNYSIKRRKLVLKISGCSFIFRPQKRVLQPAWALRRLSWNFIVRQLPTGGKDDYDSTNSWISGGLPNSSRRRRKGEGRWEGGELRIQRRIWCNLEKIRPINHWITASEHTADMDSELQMKKSIRSAYMQAVDLANHNIINRISLRCQHLPLAFSSGPACPGNSSISASPERLFSSSGNTMTKKRSSLSSHNFEECVCLFTCGLFQVHKWAADKKVLKMWIRRSCFLLCFFLATLSVCRVRLLVNMIPFFEQYGFYSNLIGVVFLS